MTLLRVSHRVSVNRPWAAGVCAGTRAWTPLPRRAVPSVSGTPHPHANLLHEGGGTDLGLVNRRHYATGNVPY